MRAFADLATPEWIEGQMGRRPPPMYVLAPPEEVREDALWPIQRRLTEAGGDGHIDETSGALRFRLRRADVADPGAFFGLLAHHLDPRHYGQAIA